ncbi:unnamed protein product [Paramecium pentaurelia]|uniref:Uncharacterized protein n=1 Tax=Paramecium pentaurelia TaxID=43138 RepID=A0A8S1UTN3_9CILI|nr:unnamed protein product [Paramecium pentaurelia]
MDQAKILIPEVKLKTLLIKALISKKNNIIPSEGQNSFFRVGETLSLRSQFSKSDKIKIQFDKES